ncbi:MAG: transcription termination factor Rho [Candidatus Calescibacterium sp.]|nr:transcription termination factor Rho [Candidatus Calescibacterium sp.]MDW8086698.1 transcription termination factor Rho [Candidatus Calescibacterium sp.]
MPRKKKLEEKETTEESKNIKGTKRKKKDDSEKSSEQVESLSDESGIQTVNVENTDEFSSSNEKREETMIEKDYVSEYEKLAFNKPMEQSVENIEQQDYSETSKYTDDINQDYAEQSFEVKEVQPLGETLPEPEVEEEEEIEKPKEKPVRKKPIPSRLNEIIERENGEESYILLNKVSSKTISELIKLAYDLEIQNPASLRRQELITEIMTSSYSNYGIRLYAEGIFQQIESGVGFLRLAHNNYLQSSDDVFVSKQLIKKYGLRSGDVVLGEIRPPEDENKGKYFSLQSIKNINFSEPWKSKERTLFENLIPYYPTKKFNLDIQFNGDISCRVVDIIAPIGKGQRGLIVSPPRAGKTMLMQNLAKAILTNHPEVIMIVLLIDERPEEVTDWKKNILSSFKDRNIEVVAATFDEKPEIHIKVADITLAKAKRLVEYKYDVVVFLDSITRLTRAYNQYIPSSGKVLTGGIDSAALQFPKKFFGAARAIEGGGSLTIIATCLIDTGSRMDEVIFEEFKGTGNMEIYLDRRISEKRIFPAIDVHRSGTRKEELLIHPDNLPKIWLLRKVLQPMSTIDAMELLHEKIFQTKSNNEFFQILISGS